MVGILLSFSPVAKADVQPSQEELTQQLISLIVQMIAQLQQQLNDMLAQQAITNTSLSQIQQNTTPAVGSPIVEVPASKKDLVVTVSNVDKYSLAGLKGCVYLTEKVLDNNGNVIPSAYPVKMVYPVILTDRVNGELVSRTSVQTAVLGGNGVGKDQGTFCFPNGNEGNTITMSSADIIFTYETLNLSRTVTVTP